MPLGPLDWFPRVLFESQRALLLPRSPQRERTAVDTELWCTLHALHVCRKNLWAIQSLDVQVRRIPMSSLAQFASGMRQLNCGSSSRFRIHLAQMWVKTNRTKTESMDINTMLFLAFDIRTSTWPTTNPISSRVSHVSVAPGGAVFFPRLLRSGPGWVWKFEAGTLSGGEGGPHAGSICQTNLCVFFCFLKFWFLWNTSRQIQLLQSQLYYFKADRIKTCQRIKTRAILIHQKQP